MKLPILAFSILLLSGIHAQDELPLFFKTEAPFAHTYSIVAFDHETGQMGIAVQSHWYAVGKSVPFAEAGVGVCAVQSMVDLSYGPEAMYLIAEGATADEAVAKVVEKDKLSNVRQFALVDNVGNVGGHTGANCIDHACDYQGFGYSVQANLMAKPGTCEAMATAYETSKGRKFADRLLLALEAAERAGGELRGKQSAALVIVNGEHTGIPWVDKPIEIHVDDHADPVQELRRLYTIKVAYDEMNQGDLAMEKLKFEDARVHYNNALFLFPENTEMQYWVAITMANTGYVAEAAEILRDIYREEPKWRELTGRLPKAGFLKVQGTELEMLNRL